MEPELTRKYKLLNLIGEGTFGKVYRAQHKKTGKIVAIKQIRVKKAQLTSNNVPIQALCEAKALEIGQGCPNICQIYDVFAYGSTIAIVMEYCPSDLSQIIKHYLRQGKTMPHSHIKAYLEQILRGIAFCHRNKIMHRDIKPSNILIGQDGLIKLGDFGLATVYQGSDKKYSHAVATRWYRAPELLYGSVTYDYSVDIYAVGCIFGEMFNNAPLFPGENDIDQLTRVMSSFGNPDESTWPGVSDLPDYNKITFRSCSSRGISELVPNAGPEAVKLLEKLICCVPQNRITASDALRDEYFLTYPLPANLSDLPLLQKVQDIKTDEIKQFRMPDC